MEYWIVYDLESGLDLYAGNGTIGTASIQPVPEGAGLIVVPQAVVAQRPFNLDPLRSALLTAIDIKAEEARAQFVTALPAQVGIYLMKAAAVRRWLADPTASTAMFQPEATGRRMTLEALASEVLSLEAQWEVIGGQIEGLRFTAKVAVEEATTIGALAAAGNINWEIGHAEAA